MGDPLKKVKVGDPLRISAAAYNSFVDAAKDLAGRRQDIGGAPGRQFRQTGIVTVQNNSGGDRDRFDVLGIDGVMLTPTDNLDEFKNTVLLTGITPTDPEVPDYLGRFVILLEPLAKGDIGRACIDGATIARLDVIDTADRYAGVVPGGVTKLRTGANGTASIVWKESGTGEKWGVVILAAGTEKGFWAVVVSSIGYGGRGVHELALDGGVPYGHYIDEIDPNMGHRFHPSHTRDGSDTYIPTVAENWATPYDDAWTYHYNFSPLRPYSVVYVRRALNTRAENAWIFSAQPPIAEGQISSIETTEGDKVRFRFLGVPSMTPFYARHLTDCPNGERMFPFPLVGDRIKVSVHSYDFYSDYNYYFTDLTARIPFEYEPRSAPPNFIARDVYTDGGDGSRGKVWHWDKDTDT